VQAALNTLKTLSDFWGLEPVHEIDTHRSMETDASVDGAAKAPQEAMRDGEEEIMRNQWVRVSAIRARGLPSNQPILGRADPYVMIFVKDEDDDIDSKFVFRSSCIKPAASACAEIAWAGEEFLIPVPEGDGKGALCLLLYTHDRILDDQLLGSVEVPIDEVAAHEQGITPRARGFHVVNKQAPCKGARLSMAVEVMSRTDLEVWQRQRGEAAVEEGPQEPAGAQDGVEAMEEEELLEHVAS